MADFIFKVVEPSNHKDRSRNSQRFNVLIAFGIFALVALLSDWKYGLIIAIVFFVVQYFKSSRWDKYFITDVIVNNEQAIIRYKEENKEKETTGNKNDFKLKKEIAFNKTRTTYLAVYYKGDLLIKQFEIGEWNEEVFDKVIAVF